MTEEFWFRCEVRHYSVADEWGDHAYISRRVEISKYVVIRHTSKGVWLKIPFNGERFVLGTSKKQFAVPTRELAIADMIERKKAHIGGCEARLHSAKEDLRLLENTIKFGRY